MTMFSAILLALLVGTISFVVGLTLGIITGVGVAQEEIGEGHREG
jgi:hypothetical protein